MAHTAHETSQSTSDCTQPSIFDVLAQDNLIGGLQPALKHLLKLLSSWYPSKLSAVNIRFDECYLVFHWLLENHYIKRYGASFAENFYGLKRVLRSNGQNPDTSTRYRSLIFLVFMPYLRKKLDAFYASIKDDYGPDKRNSLNQQSSVYDRVCCQFVRVYPMLQSALELWSLLLQLAYVCSQSTVHSPWLYLAGVKLMSLTPDDYAKFGQHAAFPPMPSNQGLLAVLMYCVRVFPRLVLTAISRFFGLGVFFLQFLDWWYSNEQTMDSNKAMASALPSAPQTLLSESEVQRLSSRCCPLCKRTRRNDTVLSVSGSVWDYILGPELKFAWRLSAEEEEIDDDRRQQKRLTEADLCSSFEDNHSRESSQSTQPSLDDIEHPFRSDHSNTMNVNQLIITDPQTFVCSNCRSFGCDGRRCCEVMQVSAMTSSSQSSTMVDTNTTCTSSTHSSTELDNSLTLSQTQPNIVRGDQPYRHTEDSSSSITVLSRESSVQSSDAKAASSDTPPMNRTLNVVPNVNMAMAVGTGTECNEPETPPPSEQTSRCASVPLGGARCVDMSTIYSDEQYAATHALSNHLLNANKPSSDRVVNTKILLVADRELLVVAFVFVARHGDTDTAWHALSWCLPKHMHSWYMLRHDWCTAYMTRLVPQLKASLIVENMDEVLCRMTSEWAQLLALLGTLQTHSLHHSPVHVQDTYLSAPDLQHNQFVCRSLCGHLQSASHSLVMGNDKRAVLKMLRTLYLFTWSADRWCSLMPNTLPAFSAHVLLQACAPTSLTELGTLCVQNDGGLCVVDMDKEQVYITHPVHAHTTLHKQALTHEVNRILGLQPIIPQPIKSFVLLYLPGEFRRVSGKSEQMCADLLLRMDLLPYSDIVRLGYVNQFMRYLVQRAIALITNVKNRTIQSGHNAKLPVSVIRKGLDLQSDATFTIVLAVADRIHPAFAHFVRTRS